MLPEDDGQLCTCKCHTGVSLYHVVWRPCCWDPVDGGIQMRVYCLPKANPTDMIIGRDEEDVLKNYERILKSE